MVRLLDPLEDKLLDSLYLTRAPSAAAVSSTGENTTRSTAIPAAKAATAMNQELILNFIRRPVGYSTKYSNETLFL